MADVQTISVVIAAVSLVIGVINSIITSRSAERTRKMELETRQAQLFMQIYDHFNKPEFFDSFTDFLTWKWKDYDDFLAKYGRKANPKAWYSLGSVGAFFEGIGVLVHRKLLDVGLVSQLMSRHIIMFWKKMQPITKEMRRRLEVPEIDRMTEYLYHEMVTGGK